MRRTLLVVLAVAALTGATGAVPAAAQPRRLPAAAERPLRVLAAGDSYAAGEGLPGIQRGEGACQRALGNEAEGATTPSKAWPVLLKETFEQASGAARWQVDPFWFVACTGNTTENFATRGTQRGNGPQLAEARAGAGDAPWDVVTLSFGGNDVGFSDIVKDCIGFDDDLLDLEAVASPATFAAALLDGAFAGCSLTEQQMKDQVERVLPGRLGTLYGQVAEAAAPGALVVVTGYPQLFADPSIWSVREKLINRCNRVSEGDARAIRGATGFLNRSIGAAVTQAQADHPDQRWVFVDVNTAFESSIGATHGLCGPDEWINGFSFGGISDGDLRGLDAAALKDVVTQTFNRSYHPNQAGHGGYAQVAAARVRATRWTPAAVLGRASTAALTPDGLGDLRIGMDLGEAHDRGLVGPPGPGCELAGGGSEYADLTVEGVTGNVVAQDGVVTNVSLFSGEVAPGASIGDLVDDFSDGLADDYRSSLDPSYEEVFGIWLLDLEQVSGDGTLTATIDPDTSAVLSVSAPFTPFCE